MHILTANFYLQKIFKTIELKLKCVPVFCIDGARENVHDQIVLHIIYKDIIIFNTNN